MLHAVQEENLKPTQTSVPRSTEVRARVDLLRATHSLFGLSLPTPQDAESGRYGSVSETSLADLQDDITILRADIRSLPIRLQQIDIEQVTIDADIDRLIESFDCLLGMFERSVQELKKPMSTTMVPGDAICASGFPQLLALGNWRRQIDRNIAKDATSTAEHRSPNDPIPENQTLLSDKNQKGTCSLTEIASNIRFPPPQTSIATCRQIVNSFVTVIAELFPDALGRWNVNSQLEDYKEAEIKAIEDAQSFCAASTSLFRQLKGSITCKAHHVAQLHLSGFHTQRLEMLVSTCQERHWIPACFVPSTATICPGRNFGNKICSDPAIVEYQSQTVHVSFNETAVWENSVQDAATYDLLAATAPATLDKFLRGGPPTPGPKPNRRTKRLEKIDRKIVGVHLACSLFQLCGSPWLQQEFEGDKVLILPHPTPLGRSDYWRPHISCALGLNFDTRSLPEDVAALGVLILELEANSLADWTDEDEEYDTATKSNILRLARILKEWSGELPDGYRKVGAACLHFESLMEDFDNSKVEKKLGNLAIIYKQIVNPLFQLLVSDFGTAERLFRGIPGLSVPRQTRTATRGRLTLYDDLETTERDKKSEYAEKFLKNLEPLLNKIKALRSEAPAGLAETMQGIQPPDKIRIAILDTGVDPTDNMIKGAASRIKERRSWIKSPELDKDNYGHGTHVTRLLLQMAPAAEIYIAKISDTKHVDPKDMSRISEAIDWAVEKNVHIISMSFGFYDQNDAIDASIDRAFKADKLLFVAASNEGGNKKRSRPARSSRVMCIHASDGNGNKGDMSPSPMNNRDNFTTLGVGVPSKWKKQTVYKSGTSFATPIAAGIAANILEFANFKCELAPEDKKRLYKLEGMQEVFRVMSTKRDKYDYVQPDHLWCGRDDDEVAKSIEAAIADL